jgi:hypothetical protein
MRIGSYTDAETVLLSPNQESTITFNSWTPRARNLTFARCSLYLANDRNRANDTLTKSFFVRVRDVGVLDMVEGSFTRIKKENLSEEGDNGRNRFQNEEILSQRYPINLAFTNSFTFFPDTIDSGDVYIPRARIKNFGNTTATFWAKYSFGSLHAESLEKTLLPDSEISFNFRPFSVEGRGLVIRTCTTNYPGDLVSENNYKRESTFIRVRDVGVAKICAPTGVLDSGAIVTPSCSVYNYGNTTESYSVRMKIGTFYNQTAMVSNHLPETYVYITFPTWTANQTGTHLVSCSTELTTDRQRLNDRKTDSVIVRPPFFRDVGCLRIIQPTGVVDSGEVLTPTCSVYNYGTTTESYSVRMKIGTFYNQTAFIQNHNPGTARYLRFPDWTPRIRGSFPVSCSTELLGDMNTGNDRSQDSVFVRVLDMAGIDILIPGDSVRVDSVFTPTARAQNLGNTTVTLPTYFVITSGIDTVYKKMVNITVWPDSIKTVAFPDTFIGITGWYQMRFWTELSGDQHPENDLVSDSFEVYQFVGIGEKEGKFGVEYFDFPIKSNPASGPIALRFLLSSGEPVQISIYNPSGRIIYKGTGMNRRREPSFVEFRIGKLSPGVYLLQLERGAFKRTEKLVVLK